MPRRWPLRNATIFSGWLRWRSRSASPAMGTRSVSPRRSLSPLRELCRDVCHYCTFARAPREGEPHYLSPDAVLDIARAGQAAGCKEALFTLGDQPELRYAAARDALAGARRRVDAGLSGDPPRRWCCARPACCRISTPASWTRPGCVACKRCPSRKASCLRPRPRGCRNAAARILARRTRHPWCASPHLKPQDGPACRSPLGS